MAVVDAVYDFLVGHPWLIVLGFVLYCLAFALSVSFSGPKPGPNPFTEDLTQPLKPHETDQSVRDRMLKQGFNVKKIPNNLDAIVIGSGIGGLTTAAILAKAGKKVLVLEQHDQAGGCCHTYVDKGFEFDVGIHCVGEMQNNTLTKLLAEQITEGQLQWQPLHDPTDVVALGKPGKQKLYPHMSGEAQWREKMIEMFPKETAAIDKYLQLLKAVRSNTLGMVIVKYLPFRLTNILISTGLINFMTSFFKYSSKTLSQVMDELTDNEILKSVLSFSFGDYGTPPSETSFAMHALLIIHFQRGASYPVGGASEIAFHIIPVIEKSGGRVLVRAPVKEIIIGANGRAEGVRVGKGQDMIDIMAPIVVSAAGVCNTLNKLLPKELAAKTAISKLLKKNTIRSGYGAMSLFVGLRGTTEELGLKAQNIWAFTGNNIGDITTEYINMTVDQATDTDVPLLFISFPSAKDPTHESRYPGKSTCTVVTLANWEWFSAWKDKTVMKRGDDYNAIKDPIGFRMWEQVCSLYPQLADKVEYISYSSPVTNYHYIAAPKGEIYGLDHNLERFSPKTMCALRPEIPEIPGLYLSGQDVFICGFSGALFGGLICAGKILHRQVYKDLVNLRKNIAASKKDK